MSPFTENLSIISATLRDILKDKEYNWTYIHKKISTTLKLKFANKQH